MYSLISKIMFLLWTVCLCFGMLQVNSSYAKDDWSLLFQVPMISVNANAVKRVISGHVYFNNSGLGGVDIFEGEKHLTSTNSQGYYEVKLLYGLSYTLVPQKENYQFTPSSKTIPAGTENLSNQNFTAQQLPIVTASGNVKWITSANSAITSNPIPNIAVEAHQYQDCNGKNPTSLYARSVTDADGDYSMTLPDGWCGYLLPIWESGINFKQCSRFNLNENLVCDFQTPYNNDRHKITITVSKSNGELGAFDRFLLMTEGKDHAEEGGPRSRTYFGRPGSTSTYENAGWTGDIYLESGNSKNYTFNPARYSMNGILHTDLEIHFTVTEN